MQGPVDWPRDDPTRPAAAFWRRDDAMAAKLEWGIAFSMYLADHCGRRRQRRVVLSEARMIAMTRDECSRDGPVRRVLGLAAIAMP